MSVTTARRSGSRLNRRVSFAGVGFVTPFLIGLLLFVGLPIGYAIYLSLFRTQLVGGTSFVGLENYLTLFRDANFWSAFGRVALVLAVQVPIMLVLSLIAALALDSARLYGVRFFRIAIFLPYAVPGVIAALLWGFIYGNQFGLTAAVNSAFGWHLAPLSSDWILASIGNIVTWEFVGYNMLIFFAALRTIAPELYEAAEIDGAGVWRTIFSIKLPALRGAIVVAVIFSIIGTFQLFNEPNLLQPLAPNAITSFFTPNMYAYNLSFAGQQFNYSATVAIVMGVITSVIAYVVQVRGTRAENR